MTFCQHRPTFLYFTTYYSPPALMLRIIYSKYTKNIQCAVTQTSNYTAIWHVGTAGLRAGRRCQTPDKWDLLIQSQNPHVSGRGPLYRDTDLSGNKWLQELWGSSVVAAPTDPPSSWCAIIALIKQPSGLKTHGCPVVARGTPRSTGFCVWDQYPWHSLLERVFWIWGRSR